ncbi:MAG: efflux RND transporter periplasmic adaptor subunit [Candidatus Magasanikbacteria bacterium]
MNKILNFIKNKKWRVIIALAVFGVGGYMGWQKIFSKTEQVTYVTGTVERGLLSTTISGTGQVSPVSQVDIKSEASGDVVTLNIKNGQTVKEGDVLAQTDSRDSALSVNQAKINLDLAQLQLNELLSPASDATLLTAENSLLKAQEDLTKLKVSQETEYEQTVETKQKAEDTLEKSYEDAYNTVASTFLDLPDIMGGIYSVLLSSDLSKSEPTLGGYGFNDGSFVNSILYSDSDNREKMSDYVTDAKVAYNIAKKSYDAVVVSFKNTTRYSDKDTIMQLLVDTLETSKQVADAVKETANVVDFWSEYRESRDLEVFDKVSEYETELASYTSQNNSHVSSLLSNDRTVEDSEESIVNAERSLKEMEVNNPIAIVQAERNIKELEVKYDDLKDGNDELDIQNQKLTVEQRRNDLWSAQQSLSNHYVKAPFEGVIVDVPISRGDSISSGSTIASIITSQKIAEITLNEVDIAKVKLEQKVNLTFDAVEDLEITGKVVEIDNLGTVSQGVVSYTVKIAFDVQDERIKPNMSVSAEIITNSKNDILMVESSAIKSDVQGNYVEEQNNGKIEKKYVTTGLTNDTMTEIIQGLSEGETIITQTVRVNSTNTTNSTQQNNPSRQGGNGNFPVGGPGGIL